MNIFMVRVRVRVTFRVTDRVSRVRVRVVDLYSILSFM
jgi:hypothetical protein